SANIGIRGTAVYSEVERSRTHVRTCYGEAVLEPRGDPAARETVRTLHREQPRYILAKGANIGIRGTAVYSEVERSRTHVRTCYGEAVLEPRGEIGRASCRERVEVMVGGG